MPKVLHWGSIGTNRRGRVSPSPFAADLLGTEVDVDFSIPAQLHVGIYTEFSGKWSMTGNVTWLDISEFGVIMKT